jgi:hypothetical protein
MKCLDCSLKYIGQTGKVFNIRYKEHTQIIKENNSNSGYLNPVLNTGHTYRTTADNIDIVKIGKKDGHLNSLEKYDIYRISEENLRMNGTYDIDTYNPIFETL